VKPTVDSEVAKRGAGSSLHFDVGALKEEKDGLQRVTVDFSYIYRRIVLVPASLSQPYLDVGCRAGHAAMLRSQSLLAHLSR
jgi:hypothetical protein